MKLPRDFSKIYVAGHKGMVGSAIVKELSARGYDDVVVRTRAELDLANQSDVFRFFEDQKIDQVFVAAARVGGIQANSQFPAEFIYENLVVQTNIIHAAWRSDVRKLLFLGSSCIYPRLAAQPMQEAALLTGPIEPTNEAYAVAKIAGMKMCEAYSRQYGVDYRSVMPTNLYGPGDNYHPENSHVVPALLGRFHEAKTSGQREVLIWGTGTPMREFLYIDDLARACVHVMNIDESRYRACTDATVSHVNIGVGRDLSIANLAQEIALVVGYEGTIKFDPSKPDGSPRKLLDVSRIAGLGWQPRIALREGLQLTYQRFLADEKRE